VLVAPPHRPYAPGFDSLGVNLSRLVVVSTRSPAETLWATERCLRSGACAAVLAWPGPSQERALRRLQLAAEEGKSFGVVFGPTRNAAQPSPAPLRIQLSAGRGRLELQILKRRGGGWAPPLSIAIDAQRAARPPTPAFAPGFSPATCASRAPLTPGPSPAAGRGEPVFSRPLPYPLPTLTLPSPDPHPTLSRKGERDLLCPGRGTSSVPGEGPSLSGRGSVTRASRDRPVSPPRLRRARHGVA
jgi:hypothetical protein